MRKLLKAVLDPSRAVRHTLILAKGQYYKALYTLLRRNVQIGRNFKVDGSMHIHGPGRVIIGDDVTVGMHVTPWTHSRNAVLRIGNGVYLNGTRFGCEESIEIGDRCILADCRILDTDFHGIHPDRRKEVKTAPIVIQNDVWITMQCVVLKGVTIAAGSTVTPNSVVNESLPEPNSLYGGNPAKFVKKLR